MFNPGYFFNSRPDGISVLEVTGPEGEGPPFVPLRGTELEGTLTGPLADLRLVQIFGFDATVWHEPIEAAYRFPLPGDAAVTGVTVRFGEVEIVAELATRAEAEARYQEAKAAGKQAALATREAPDVFTLLVTGIAPGAEVRVTTNFLLLARSRGLDWTARIPLTTAPRYMREDERTSRHGQGQPLRVLRDPGHRFAMAVRVTAAAHVSSPTHELALTEEDEGFRVRLAAGEVVPDRDCVLVWRPAQAATQPALAVHRHDAIDEDASYLLASITPPATQPASVPAREVILLVDHSGSMHGAKWQATDWAVEAFLIGMRPTDHFALACFHNTPHWFKRGLTAAEPAAVQAAVAWLKQQRESGGTNLGVALEQALDLSLAPGEATRHVLIMTDAAVTDAGRILRLVDEAAQAPAVRRVSVLCIDAAPNDALVNEMVRRSGGSARFLTSDPSEEDITTALDEVLTVWAEPVLTGLRLAVDQPALQGSRRHARAPEGWSALDVGDLPAGQSIWMTARAAPGAGERIRVQLLQRDGAVLAAVELDPTGPATQTGVRALYGADRINALEYLMHGQLEPATLQEELRRLGWVEERLALPAAGLIYAENRAEATAEALATLLAEEALRYGLPSAETAFVAIRHEAGKPVTTTVPVANALPHGWEPALHGGARLLAADAAAGSAPFGPPQMMYGPGAPNALPGLVQPAGMPLPATGGLGIGGAEASYHELFSGTPTFRTERALLYEDEPVPDAEVMLQGLRVTADEKLIPAELSNQVELLLFVEDMTSARARVQLRSAVQLGDRPLNVRKPRGARVRLELVDPQGELPAGAYMLEVALAW